MTPLQASADVFDRCPATKVICAVSGGKDSLCILDLAVRRYGAKNVVGFLMVLVPDLEVEWALVHRLEKRYGIKVHAVPHWDLARLLKHGIYRDHRGEPAAIKKVTMGDVEDHVRKLAGPGFDFVCWGERCTDSIPRNAKLKKCRGVNLETRRLYPIYTWKAKPDVYGYLKARNIPVPRITGGTKAGGGVVLTAQCLIWMRDNYHNDYAKILARFPYAGAMVFRHEVLKVDPIAEVKARFRKKKPDGFAQAQSSRPAQSLAP